MLQAPRIVLTTLLVSGSLIAAFWPTGADAQQPAAQPSQEQPAPSPAPGAVPSNPPRAVDPSETPAGHAQTQSLVGLVVFASDGTRVGEVRSVSAAPGGDIVALHVRTGGFLGFGGRIVAIPGSKFIRSGHSIRLDLDSDEVTGLPEVKD
jgi:hypothetical protein